MPTDTETPETPGTTRTPNYRFVLAGIRRESQHADGSAATHVTPRGTVSGPSDDYEKSLWDKITSTSPKAGKQVVEDAVRTLSDMRQVEQVRDEIGVDQVERMRVVVEAQIWTLAGYKSFREFLISPDRPCKKSAGYRYKAVAEFTETFPLGDAAYDAGLYERFNVPQLVEPGVHETLAEANRYVSRGRFGDVARIASLFNRGALDHAAAEELLAKNLILDEASFDDEIKALTNNIKESVADQMRGLGVFGMCLIVPVNERERSVAKLREIADRLERGEDMTGPVVERELEIGRKSVTFHELSGENDGFLIGVV